VWKIANKRVVNKFLYFKEGKKPKQVEHKYIFLVYHVSERMIRTELYCVTKNFYPLIFILGDNSYKKYSRSKNFEALADDMVIDPKRRVFILEEDSIVDTSNDSLVEENMLDVGLKHSLRIE
jgi:hypothetical protein